MTEKQEKEKPRPYVARSSCCGPTGGFLILQEQWEDGVFIRTDTKCSKCKTVVRTKLDPQLNHNPDRKLSAANDDTFEDFPFQ